MTSFKVQELIPFFENAIFHGDLETEVGGVINLDMLESDEDLKSKICWVSDKQFSNLKNSKIAGIGLLILSKDSFQKLTIKPMVTMVAEEPRKAFQQLLKLKFETKKKSKVESSAIIAGSAKIGKNCYIGHHVVIEENVVVGDDCTVEHNTVILAKSQIGNHVVIGNNCTIGGVGFGYEKSAIGNYEPMIHLGNVVIHDFVTIHNNTCIDRAVIGSTEIGMHTKIDNLVHIAHGVKIGSNTLVIANAMIAGSTKIGDNCWVAPSASILNKLTVESESIVGMGAVVIKDVASKGKVVGNPAKEITAK